MPQYSAIFWSFFKIGTFTIGGGYAMIPLMQHELVEKHAWITEEEFLDSVALSQALPGVFAVNMAAMTGFRLRKGWGSAVAILGNVAMPIIIILILATLFRSFRQNPYVEHFFLGLRPAVVALIAAPVFTMWKKEAQPLLPRLVIPILSALLIWLLGVNPIIIVLLAAFAGFIYSKINNRE